MELTPYQTHASLALIGFGISGAVAGNVELAAGCFGGIGALHLYVLCRLALADWRYARKQRQEEPPPEFGNAYTGFNLPRYPSDNFCIGHHAGLHPVESAIVRNEEPSISGKGDTE